MGEGADFHFTPEVVFFFVVRFSLYSTVGILLPGEIFTLLHSWYSSSW
jgi:hypothetical protein